MSHASRAFVIAIASIIIFVGPMSASMSVLAADGPSDPPISIDGNVDLAAQAALNGWEGDGSKNKPYVISGLSIKTDSPQPAIIVNNTTAHLIIADCLIAPNDPSATGDGYFYYPGIRFFNVTNTRISGLTATGFDHSIVLDSCRDVTIDNSTMSEAHMQGFLVSSSTHLTIENNTICGMHGNGLSLQSTDLSLIQLNNVSFNKGIGLDLDFVNSNNVIRWNLASTNGGYSYGHGMYLAGNGNVIYGNVFVGAGGKNSAPVRVGVYVTNTWSSPEGVGNYYGINYDSKTGLFGNLTGRPVASLTDADSNGIADGAYVISSDAPNDADHNPLMSPAFPPRDLRAAVSGDMVTLTWSEPLYTTCPIGHYVVSIDNGGRVSQHAVSGTSFVDQVEDPDSWTAITYTVRWVGKFLSSGPSNEAIGRNPDRPAVEIVSDMGVGKTTLGGITIWSNRSLDPRSVLVAWAGFDSNSDEMNYFLKVDNGPWMEMGHATNRTFSGLAEGGHIITVRAIDDDGNQIEDSKTFSVYQYIEMSLFCSPFLDDGKERLRVRGTAWDTVAGDPMAGLPIVLSYTVDGGQSWTFRTVTTGPDGSFQSDFGLEKGAIMGVTLVTETFDQNWAYHTFFENVTYVAMTLQDRDGIFLTQSTSMLSEFTYSSTMLRFTVDGDSGTSGSTSIIIPKSAVNGVDGIRMTLDGEPVDHSVSEEGDYWILTFNYSHSAHQVVVEIPSNRIFGILPPDLVPLIVLAMVGAVVAAGVGVFLFRRKRA